MSWSTKSWLMVAAHLFGVHSSSSTATHTTIPIKSNDILVGAHYFSGWSRNCNTTSPPPHCYSHFQGFTPTGERTNDWFPAYPERTPLLGMLTTDETTVAREVHEADKALDFFDMLYYDGGYKCGTNPTDPNGLSYCLDSALAFMVRVWTAKLPVLRDSSYTANRSNTNGILSPCLSPSLCLKRHS